MSKLNDKQQLIADTTEGMLVVDAGPGTGKTHTIVDRYINIVTKPDVNPTDVLALTFTNNAANEMEQRIKGRMSELGMEKDAKLVQAKTFDSFCMSVVLDSPDMVSSFFGMEEKLTRAAYLEQNETLNKDYFMKFLDQFMFDKGADYGDIAVIASQNADSLLELINKLMSRGLIPLKRGWFGNGCKRDLEGDTESLPGLLSSKNVSGKGMSILAGVINDMDEQNVFKCPSIEDKRIPEEAIQEVLNEDRTALFDFIHDVYYDYIRRSISDNRLTFGLNAMFAFTVLYANHSVRERNSYRYLMVDEFQDTNASQLMICLMILKQPNLCVVGDWKQGIYGFRYVSIDNILNFEKKLVDLRKFLNDDYKRIPFSIPETEKISLEVNYRSSQLIIDKAYDSIYIPGTKEEKVDSEALDNAVVRIKMGRTDLTDKDTAIRFVKAESADSEVDAVIDAIKDYVKNEEYSVIEEGVSRKLGFGDIAVICRKTSHCRLIRDACEEAGIPAYLHGEVQIMSTREGKLTLAWLKYINNERDQWGFVPIMADMGYTPEQVVAASDNYDKVPQILKDQRSALYLKRRRITDLLTCLFSFYHLDNDITQSIIAVISKIYRDSLMTISDVITLIENDIENEASYSVENVIDGKAVSIMTMHKSKGLEFPVVIAPFIDSSVMPSTKGDSNVFTFDETAGIRCSLEIGTFGDYSKICRSWKTALVKAAVPRNYDEERRLMFVALSRAKQYETVICGNKPSRFMTELSGEQYEEIVPIALNGSEYEENLCEKPVIGDYSVRPKSIGVHDLMNFDESSSSDGKGMEYGEEIHRLAELIANGKKVTDTYPELEMIRRIVDESKWADLIKTEVDCALPINELNAILRGRIDLLLVGEDRVEVHDYKTDVSELFEHEYALQLSIYAYAASQYYEKPVKIIIDYVSMGYSKTIDPVPMEEIVSRTRTFLSNVDKV